jgi:PAS domain S-box-containing protein
MEGRYRLLVDAITDYAIYMLDTDGHVSSWNAGAQRFKGYTESEILGEQFSRFYTPEELAVCPQGHLRLLKLKVVSMPRVGVCARTVNGFGHMWSSTPSGIPMVTWSALRRSPAI